MLAKTYSIIWKFINLIKVTSQLKDIDENKSQQESKEETNLFI